MISRRSFIGSVALSLLSAPSAVEAQPPTKIPRIGYLTQGLLNPEPSPERAAFLEGLREAGYVSGETIIVEYRSAALNLELLPDLAQELVDIKVDVIVLVGGQAAQAARDVTKTVPIVVTGVADPVGAGLVASLAHPGGNVTGQAFTSSELGGKRIALLKEAFPRISRVAVLLNPAERSSVLELKETETVARSLGLTLRPVEMRRAQDLDRALAAVTRERPDALVTIPDLQTTSVRVFIVEFAAKRRLPAMYGFREFVEVGGLLFYGADIAQQFRRAAAQVGKILKGAEPRDIPVELPTKFELIVNLKTAKALRLTIPQSVLIRADQVIE